MSIRLIVNKVFSLLGTLNNPYYFLYRLYHYLNKYVPHNVASYIYKKNIIDYQKKTTIDFLIDTYDGSGQAVHPDISYWNNQFWLVLTPYPYGMEEYENPCIYRGASLEVLIVPDGPIAFQHKHAPGIHLSDPCLTKNGDSLFCYYRESERQGQTEEQKIWETKYIEDNNTWSEPRLIMSSNDDKFLSPAMLYDEEGVLNVFYVSSLNNKFNLVRELIGDKKKNVETLHVYGLPEEVDLWHIGISKMVDIDNSCRDDNRLIGLFSVKSKKKSRGMRLFQALSTNWGRDWNIIKEIMIPHDLKDEIQFPYKSCYIPLGKGNIFLSFRDKESRNRFTLLDNYI